MIRSVQLEVLRVFCDDRGRFGNPLGIVTEGWLVDPARRQEIATELGFSETVFVLDGQTGALTIHTPIRELGFAGHPLVGTAWLLAQHNDIPPVLRPPAGEVPFVLDDQLTWVLARPEHSPLWKSVQLGSVEEVIDLKDSFTDRNHTQVWAWLDEPAGLIRARVFASDYGIPEDPATGSAGIVLAAELGRKLTIIQGPADECSEIHLAPQADGSVMLGGLVVLDRPASSLPL